MQKEMFDIRFKHDGKEYAGWVTPSDKTNEKGLPKSFHVVLNEVFFGNVSFNGKQWVADEQRPQELVDEVGTFIREWYE